MKFVQEAIACDVSSVVMFIKGLAKSLIYIHTFPGTFNSFIKKVPGKNGSKVVWNFSEN